MFAFVRSLKFWIIFACVIIGGVGLTFGTISIINANTKIATPTNLAVVQASTNQKYLFVDYNHDAVGYEFVITVDKKTTRLSSTQNSLEITSFINTPATYKIKSRAIAKAGFANSDYCQEINYVSKIKISKPILTINNEEKRLYFSLEENYNFIVNLSFEMYYGVEYSPNTSINFLKITDFTKFNDDKHGNFQGYFELDSLTEKEYYLSVVAIPDNTEIFDASNLTAQMLYQTNI